ncbi:acyltransferase family protein [Komagataeibacter saccharivorans]|uniref:acyltransferase family protein n=1 Tax=Komagataeibacter saccharivorans TaxID=265959 RepID=UPI000C8667B1
MINKMNKFNLKNSYFCSILSKSSGKNIEIQYIRCIAISFVIISHISAIFPAEIHFENVANRIFFLYSGVDIFFVISGYLMGEIFLKRNQEAQSSYELTISAINFYKKRFLRLLPASTFWITILLLSCIFFHDHEVFGTVRDVFWKWCMSIIPLRNFETVYSSNSLQWYWSLSTESQFYVFLPLAWFSVPRKFFWYSCFLLMCLFLFFDHTDWFRFPGLFVGLFSYKLLSNNGIKQAISENTKKINNKFSSIWVVAIFLIATAPLCAFHENYHKEYGNIPFIVGYISIYSVSFIMISLSALCIEFIYIPEKIKNFVFIYSEISYSLYLCHLVVFFIFRHIIKVYGLIFPEFVYITLCFFISFILSLFSYIFIERKFYQARDTIRTP